MNLASFKFIGGFILILLASLAVLVYFSIGGSTENGVDPVENLVAEQA